MKNKQHMKAEMAALKRGGASKKVMSEERAEYKAEGYANGGMVKGYANGGMAGSGCFYQVTSKVDYGK